MFVVKRVGDKQNDEFLELHDVLEKKGSEAEQLIYQKENDIFFSHFSGIKATESTNNKFLDIEGYASTPDKDSYEDIIPTYVWENEETLKRYKKNPVIYEDHNTWSSKYIIGKCTEVIIDKGLYIKAKIKKTAAIAENVELGLVKGLSIGFRLKKYYYDENIRAFILTELEVFEISVVGLPANFSTVFDVKNYLKSKNHNQMEKETPNVDLLGTIRKYLGILPKKTEEDLITEGVENLVKQAGEKDATIAELSKEKAALETQLAEKDATITQLSNEKAALETQLTDLKAANDTLVSEKAALETELEKKQATIDRFEGKSAATHGEGNDPDLDEKKLSPIEKKVKADNEYFND